ncbi:hypothetical protein MUO65_07380 [bacterium]|nr:hypothetical protein [bacterium]
MIKGVAVIGRTSKNNREYSEKALQQIADLMPFGCGFSIVGKGKTYIENGVEKVEEVPRFV